MEASDFLFQYVVSCTQSLYYNRDAPDILRHILDLLWNLFRNEVHMQLGY